MLLPELFFETQDHLFLFCGTFQILGLCRDFEIKDFDFINLLFAASYLMVTDELLVGLLERVKLREYTHNSSLMHMLYTA